MSKENKPVYIIDWRKAKFGLIGLVIAITILAYVFITQYMK